MDGGQGSDGCQGAKGRTVSCGKEAPPKPPPTSSSTPTKGGGGGLQIIGGGGNDHFTVTYDPATETSASPRRRGSQSAPAAAAVEDPNQVDLRSARPGRWVMADLGPGNDSLRVEGTLEAGGNIRVAGGKGNDTIKAGPEDDLLESGPGADKLYGGDGADGLVGGLPGPTYLYGEGDGDLMAAGGGCAGGAIVGGQGRDDASFAETQAHPGLPTSPSPGQSLDRRRSRAATAGPPRRSNEDMEGSFDWDVLIGDSRDNGMLGQPGKDELLRQRRRRHDRRPRRRPRLLDPVRPRPSSRSARRKAKAAAGADPAAPPPAAP